MFPVRDSRDTGYGRARKALMIKTLAGLAAAFFLIARRLWIRLSTHRLLPPAERAG